MTTANYCDFDMTDDVLENLVIDLAWADDVSFDEIKLRTGFVEKDVIRLMRRCLKPSSFRMWRARVSGRRTKHQKKLDNKRHHPDVTNDDA